MAVPDQKQHANVMPQPTITHQCYTSTHHHPPVNSTYALDFEHFGWQSTKT